MDLTSAQSAALKLVAAGDLVKTTNAKGGYIRADKWLTVNAAPVEALWAAGLVEFDHIRPMEYQTVVRLTPAGRACLDVQP
jgi:hypothetical protein